MLAVPSLDTNAGKPAVEKDAPELFSDIHQKDLRESEELNDSHGVLQAQAFSWIIQLYNPLLAYRL